MDLIEKVNLSLKEVKGWSHLGKELSRQSIYTAKVETLRNLGWLEHRSEGESSRG